MLVQEACIEIDSEAGSDDVAALLRLLTLGGPFAVSSVQAAGPGRHCCRFGLVRPDLAVGYRSVIELQHRIDGLYQAGLRHLNVGFYGVGATYDEYVQRHRSFERVEAGIAAVRDRYGMDVTMRINWLLMRPSCNLEDLDQACRFAERYRLRIQVDLVHYSLPYFSEGPERELQFRPEDRSAVEVVTADLLRRQREQPNLFFHSPVALRSIPDWVIKGPAMQVPCDASQMIWVGADGSVQLCYVTFPLGNLHQNRFRDMVFTPAHRTAVQDAFALKCPNCHCGYDTRVEKDASSARHYRKLLNQG